MKCNKCGYEMEPTDRICKSCGELNRDNSENTHIMSLMKHSNNARTNAFQKSIDKNRLRETMPKVEKTRPIIEEIEELDVPDEPSEVELLMRQSGMTFNPDSEEPIYYPQQRRNTSNKDYSNEPLIHTKKAKPVKPQDPNKLNLPFSLIITNILITGILMAASFTLDGNIIILIIATLATMFYSVSFQVLFFKAGLPWWGYYVPLYNFYLYNKLVFRNGWYFISLFIIPILALLSMLAGAKDFLPVLGYLEIALAGYYLIAGGYRLGTNFTANGFLTLFFPFIMIPLMAFSKSYKYY